jgi:hypothetical protein
MLVASNAWWWLRFEGHSKSSKPPTKTATEAGQPAAFSSPASSATSTDLAPCAAPTNAAAPFFERIEPSGLSSTLTSAAGQGALYRPMVVARFGVWLRGTSLPASDRERILQLLVDRELQRAQVLSRDVGVPNTGLEPNTDTPADRTLAAEYGDALHAQLIDYERIEPDRQQLAPWFEEQLTVGAPLSDKQQQQVLAVLAEERSRATLPAISADPGSIQAYHDAVRAYQTRARERLASMLSDDQRARLEPYLNNMGSGFSIGFLGGARAPTP